MINKLRYLTFACAIFSIFLHAPDERFERTVAENALQPDKVLNLDLGFVRVSENFNTRDPDLSLPPEPFHRILHQYFYVCEGYYNEFVLLPKDVGDCKLAHALGYEYDNFGWPVPAEAAEDLKARIFPQENDDRIHFRIYGTEIVIFKHPFGVLVQAGGGNIIMVIKPLSANNKGATWFTVNEGYRELKHGGLLSNEQASNLMLRYKNGNLEPLNIIGNYLLETQHEDTVPADQARFANIFLKRSFMFSGDHPNFSLAETYRDIGNLRQWAKVMIIPFIQEGSVFITHLLGIDIGGSDDYWYPVYDRDNGCAVVFTTRKYSFYPQLESNGFIDTEIVGEKFRALNHVLRENPLAQ